MQDTAQPGSRLAAALKRLRAERGISQGRLAEVADIPVRTIQKWESGEVARDGPGLFNALRVARALGVPMEALVGGEAAVIPLGVTILSVDALERIRKARTERQLRSLAGITATFTTPTDPGKVRIISAAENREILREFERKWFEATHRRGR